MSKQQKSGSKLWFVAIVGGLLAVCCFGVAVIALVGGLGDDTSSSSRPPSVGAFTATPVPPAPSFEEIRQQHSVMTEAQWKQYRTQIEGTLVVGWRGWVEEVTGSPGKYKVRVDMDSPDEFLSGPEVDFIVPDDVALGLQKDQPLTFSGQIETAIDFMGSLDISLEYASIQ